MANLTGVPSGNHLPVVRSISEKKLGILHFTAPVDFGWRGDIRKRYTDFIVHEVRKDGTVVYLSEPDAVSETRSRVESENTENQQASRPKEVAPAPAPKVVETPRLSTEDAQTLDVMVGNDVSKELQDAFSAIVGGGEVPKTPITVAVLHDRTRRSHIHQEIRRIFGGRFETQADPKTGAITALPAAGRNKQRGGGRNANSASWRDNRGGGRNGAPRQNRAGPYLHFTLYKENKDTMEAINHLARMLKIKSSNFGFAGTKDRRAATTQRVSVWRHGSDDIGWLNSKNGSIKVGDFGYHKSPIQLGQHGGNEFVIVVKNVELTRGANCSLEHRLRMTESCVQSALDHIQQHGFMNYFGLQRFGTHTIGTQEVGLKILSEDFEGATEAILHVDPALIASLNDRDLESVYHRDEINRARAIAMWKMSGDLDGALQILPKRFSAESTILRHLGRAPESRRDFCGALLHITRGLRNLYIHAFQSYVWNWATSLRWSKYGDKVIAGDLVLVESEANPSRYRQGHDMSEDLNQDEEQFYQEARCLSAEEAASGNYTIFDIVLPIPGYDVLYPDNDIGAFYVEFMGRPENGGLDPYRMRRPQKEFSLSGHYRKIMARFSTVPKFFVRPYTDDAEQMHPTDLDESKALKDEQDGKRAQVIAAAKAAEAADAWTANSGISDDTPGDSGTNTEQSDAKIIGELGDMGDKTNRRRRLSPDQTERVPETRLNEAWVENTSEGGSKRVKIDLLQVGTGATAAAAAATSNAEEGLKSTTVALHTTQPTTGGHAGKEDANVPSMEDVTHLFSKGEGSAPGLHATGSGNTSRNITPPSATLPVTPAPTAGQLIQNVFKTVPVEAHPGTNSGGPAINLTDVWRKGAQPFEASDDTKVAVVLNFRLNSSNYATICLREMMSSSIAGATETAAAPASTTAAAAPGGPDPNHTTG